MQPAPEISVHAARSPLSLTVVCRTQRKTPLRPGSGNTDKRQLSGARAGRLRESGQHHKALHDRPSTPALPRSINKTAGLTSMNHTVEKPAVSAKSNSTKSTSPCQENTQPFLETGLGWGGERARSESNRGALVREQPRRRVYGQPEEQRGTTKEDLFPSLVPAGERTLHNFIFVVSLSTPQKQSAKIPKSLPVLSASSGVHM